MNESEVLRELSHKTGLPESAAEAVLKGLRELVHDGAVGINILREPEARPRLSPSILVQKRNERLDPRDPRLVDELIERARKHPLGIDFLLNGFLCSVAMALDAHAFTVDAARERLRNEGALA